jgi:hypothetical protein
VWRATDSDGAEVAIKILKSDAVTSERQNNLNRLDLVQMKEQQKQQRETVDGLLRVTPDLVKVSTNVIDRVKRLETRSDSVDETLKVLRELLEANLRRPDNPSQENN